jgi:hypothetical protein
MNKKGRERYEQVGELVSIFQRGGRWYVHCRVDGKPRRRSRGTTSKKQAQRKARAIERDLLDGRSVRPVRAPKIEDVVEQYIAHLRAAGRSMKTIKKYQHCFRLVLELAAELKIERIDQLDLAFVDIFRNRRMRCKGERQTTQRWTRPSQESEAKNGSQ